MNNLAIFINDDALSDLDPLVKLAIIHHQFESIHPFYDGNGRTGRIINILYLVIKIFWIYRFSISVVSLLRTKLSITVYYKALETQMIGRSGSFLSYEASSRPHARQFI